MIDIKNIKIYPTEYIKELQSYGPSKHDDVPDAVAYAMLTMDALIDKGEKEMIKWNEEKLKAEGYDILNARITNVDISTEDHCCACLNITLEGDGWGVIYGGYSLGRGGTYLKQEEINGSAKGFESILQIMWALETNSLVDLK